MLDYMCACNEVVLLDFEVGGREEGGSRNPILGRTCRFSYQVDVRLQHNLIHQINCTLVNKAQILRDLSVSSLLFREKLFDGTVPSNNCFIDGTVPSNNCFLDGTVLSNNLLFDGTLQPKGPVQYCFP